MDRLINRERVAFWLLLAISFAVRAFHPYQPIVENYVGRQIPTAMVARNLERGSGFLHPQLDTGPFPNLFLVEPPIYAQVVVFVRPLLGIAIEPAGRLVSAAAVVLAAWGLFGLAKRREGRPVAFMALGSFCFFPIMVRYGRAFQPDALMVGCVLAGLRGWDEYQVGGNRRWAVFGGFVLATGLALKVTVAWALIPFVLILRRWPIAWRLGACSAMLVPAMAWYLYAWGDVAHPGLGSLSSSDNASLWVRSLSLTAWLRFSTYENLGRGLFVRSFTPVGFFLGFCGLVACGKVDRLWVGWALGCGLAILGLAAKWHHAYYWMVVAPLAAVGVGRCLDRLWKMEKLGRPIVALLGSSFLALCLVQSASTWRTPGEWESLIETAREVSSTVSDSEEDLLVAPEALIYYADRRGCRLEFDRSSVRRATGEWGKANPSIDHPMALVKFYQREVNKGVQQPAWRSARVSHVADVGPAPPGSRRREFRDAIRADPHFRILSDRPGMMIAEIH